MNRFETKLAEHTLTLRRGQFQTLQINVGRKCNQTCAHCHVDVVSLAVSPSGALMCPPG